MILMVVDFSVLPIFLSVFVGVIVVCFVYRLASDHERFVLYESANAICGSHCGGVVYYMTSG